MREGVPAARVRAGDQERGRAGPAAGRHGNGPLREARTGRWVQCTKITLRVA